MTTLAITPNWKNKSAKFKGTVAAGEHVSVTIQNNDGEGGEFIDDASTLRLRVVNPCNGRTLAIFPEPVPEGETPETWDSDLSPLRCTLNLNTVQMLKAVPPAANVPLLWVLDDYDNNTLYFKEQFPVEHWPRLRGEEEPTDLDNYKDIIADFNTRLDGYDTRITGAENAAQAATGNASAAAATANQAVGIANQAVDKAETAQNSAAASAEAAHNSALAADEAQEAAESAAESINNPDATLTEEGVAADAKATGEAIAAEKERAETAEAAEETRAKGVESGLRIDLTAAEKAIDDEAVLRAAADADLEANKADKATTYTKTEVDTKIAGVQTFKKYLVQTLPDADEADMKGLYLVPTGETSEEGDLCEEWTVVEENGEKRWELIGGTTVDLSDYYDKDAVDNLLDDKQDTLTFDNAPTTRSNNPVKSGGIWAMLWGTLGAIPEGLSSVYAWVLNRLGLKRDLTDMACTVVVAGIPQIGSGNFVVTSPSGTSTTLTPFDSSGVVGWGWYRTYPYIYARASNSYDIIFGTGISDMIPLDMTAETQTVTYNGETWTVAAFTGGIANTRLANMTDIPAASTSTPQMDGTGAAGSSAAYARGDHVHPTDTSRMAATATGADIAVSGSDATKIDAALAGKASTADATLVNASDWVCSPAEVGGGHIYIVQNTSGAWYPSSGEGGIGMGKGDAQSLSLSWAADEWYGGVALTATRVALGGYVLGSQTDKPLASEAEAEALRTAVAGKQDALSQTQFANIAAVSDALAFDATHSYAAGDPVVYDGTLYTFTATHTGAWTGSDVSAVDIIARLAGKLDKSGGTMTGPLEMGEQQLLFGDRYCIVLFENSLAILDLYNATNTKIPFSPTGIGTLALTDNVPYDLGTPTVIDTASSETVEGETVYYGAATLADRTANIVQVTAATPLDELRITFPAATSGKVRDFGLRVEIGTGSAALAAPALVPVAPTGETIKIENNAAEIPALADGTATAKGVTLLYFSETAPGVFVVKGEQVE
jgi:hypothetical protein